MGFYAKKIIKKIPLTIFYFCFFWEMCPKLASSTVIVSVFYKFVLCTSMHEYRLSVVERVHLWPAPDFFLAGSGFSEKVRYALKKLKKMNNSTSCNRKNTFLRISFLFVHVGTQEQNRVQNFFSEPVPVRWFKKVKLYLQ